jgi:tRNA(Ile)-lysidine synthase
MVSTKQQAGNLDAADVNWPALAAILAGHIPCTALHKRAVAELKKIIRQGAPVGIACSGGADSVCLTLLLYAHFPELRERLSILHFDHRIRGDDSAADARFVSRMAASMGLPYRCGQWKEASPDATEEAARDARMSFLHAHAEILLFGHNLTDVAETMLLRLGRGSSIDGLAGPRPAQRFRQHPGRIHLRPLLTLSGSDIRDNLRACGIPWREDATNAGTRYTRNKLRNEVLPLLESALGRDWAAGAARSRERIEEADDDLEHEASEILHAAHEDSAKLHVSLLTNTNPAVARRILERWLEKNGLRTNLNASTFDKLLESARQGAFPKDLCIPRLSNCGEFLRWSGDAQPSCPEWTPIGIAQDCEVFFPDGTSLKTSPIELAKDSVAATIAALRKQSSLTDVMLTLPEAAVLTLRRRETGDAYRPIGANGRDKLCDMQINRKIPAPERVHLPVVLEESRIVWSPFLIPADESKLTPVTTHAVRLTYRNISPVSASYTRNAD